MKKIICIQTRVQRVLILLWGVLSISMAVNGQMEWPRTIVGADGDLLYVYQPQPDSFFRNVLRFKAAFTYVEKGKQEPRYGSFVALTIVDVDKDQRKVAIMLANVLLLAVHSPPDSAKMAYLKETLECGIPGAALDVPLDDLVCSLEPSATGEMPGHLWNDVPRIITATRPSVLVFIDGAPRLRRNGAWGINMVVNTPNIIMESFDGWYYLYGGRHWYIGPEAAGPYHFTGYIAPDVQKVQQELSRLILPSSAHTDTVREGAGIVEDIIVCSSPAELIQTRGPAVLERIPGTRLQYVANSNNDILRDTVQRRYYVLLSGRWFSSIALEGPWSYVPADGLPADMARIPEGSPKDNVLASVAGTDAAREALMDAQLPQTAVISLHGATPVVSYDGAPRFTDISGTHLQYALNTASVVLKDKEHYYCLENGVWFFGAGAAGPWSPCTERPREIELIPADCPVYFCRYVQIYSASPDYVYTGYTAGYLNSYSGGPTVLYGTGLYYKAWSGNAYYPRPWTWVFGMGYNPWFGWCLSPNLDPEWFNAYIGNEYRRAGWWGPVNYLPSYVWHHFSGHGMYEPDVRRVENISYVNNLYSYRPDHIGRQAALSLYTDTLGDVFMYQDGRGWMQREDGQWRKVGNPQQRARLDAIAVQRSRSVMRQRNFLRQRGY